MAKRVVAITGGTSGTGSGGGSKPGPPGKSAYEVAVDNGFEGTKTEWLDSLIGVGTPGDDGADGQPTTVVDSASVALQLDDNGTLTASVKSSAIEGNVARLVEDGVIVHAVAKNGFTTDNADNPLIALDPDPANPLFLSENGLKSNVVGGGGVGAVEWHEPSTEPGWTPLPGVRPLEYGGDGAGAAYLRGGLEASTPIVSGTISIGTLPADVRPDLIEPFWCQVTSGGDGSDVGTAQIMINPSGEVSVYIGHDDNNLYQRVFVGYLMWAAVTP